METMTANSPGAQYGHGTAGAPVRRLTRKNGSLSGVAGGLGDYTGIDPTIVRLGLIAGTILTFPLVPIAYVAAWAIMPEDEAITPPPPGANSVPFNPVPPAPGTPAADPMTEAADAAEAMAKARAEVEAVDRTAPPAGPVPPAPRPADQADG